MAFTQNKYPTFPLQPTNGRVQIVNADAQAQKTAYTAGANGSKIIGVIVASTDTSARDVTLYITNSGTSYPLGTKSATIAAGTATGTPAVNMLDTAVIVG